MMLRKVFLLLLAACLFVQTASAQSWEEVRAAYNRTLEKYSMFQCDLSGRTLSDGSGQEKLEEGRVLYWNPKLCYRHTRLVTLPKQSTFKTDQSFNGEYYIDVQEANSARQSVGADMVVSRESFDAMLSQVYLAVALGYFPDPAAGSASINGILNSMKIAVSQLDQAGDWMVIGAIEPNYRIEFRFSKQHDWSISKLELTNDSEMVHHFDIKSYRYEVTQFQSVDGTPFPESIKIEMTRHLVTSTQAPRPLTVADIQKLQTTILPLEKPTGYRDFLFEFEIAKPSFAQMLTKTDFDIPIPDDTTINVRGDLLTPHIYRAGRIIPKP